MEFSTSESTTFDRKEAARRLGISVVTLDRLIAKRRIPHARIGRRVLFTQSMIDSMIEMCTQKAR
ncbi:MAG: helix-turn-helix domain-containing protein [Blastocatellia bacterium]|nr:helix-turn-helix domain-containing protein [Blastocatellia bacterium]